MKPALKGLYAITDPKLMPGDRFTESAEAALASGVRILQYRDKSNEPGRRLIQAQRLRQLCDQYNVLLIINDDIQLALDVNADGVHIGKDDSALLQARQRLGDNKIIGVSCYNQLSLAHSAIQGGANYIAFGSFFGSRIKPDAPVASIELVESIRQQYATPVCCIGGITRENCAPLISAGADMLAVISDIFAHETPEAIARSCQDFCQALGT